MQLIGKRHPTPPAGRCMPRMARDAGVGAYGRARGLRVSDNSCKNSYCRCLIVSTHCQLRAKRDSLLLADCRASRRELERCGSIMLWLCCLVLALPSVAAQPQESEQRAAAQILDFYRQRHPRTRHQWIPNCQDLRGARRQAIRHRRMHTT